MPDLGGVDMGSHAGFLFIDPSGRVTARAADGSLVHVAVTASEVEWLKTASTPMRVAVVLAAIIARGMQVQ